jgi:hypothetical protein
MEGRLFLNASPPRTLWGGGAFYAAGETGEGERAIRRKLLGIPVDVLDGSACHRLNCSFVAAQMGAGASPLHKVFIDC